MFGAGAWLWPLLFFIIPGGNKQRRGPALLHRDETSTPGPQGLGHGCGTSARASLQAARPWRGVPEVATRPDPALTSATGGPGSSPPASPAPAAAPRPRPAPPSAPPPPCKAHGSKHRAGPGPALALAPCPSPSPAARRQHRPDRGLAAAAPAGSGSASLGPARTCGRGVSVSARGRGGSGPGLRGPGGCRVPLRRSPEGAGQGGVPVLAVPARRGRDSAGDSPLDPGKPLFLPLPSALPSLSCTLSEGARAPQARPTARGTRPLLGSNRVCPRQPWQRSGPRTQSPGH